MSPLLLGALVVGGVGALVLVSGSEVPDPTPTREQLLAAVNAFQGITMAQQPMAPQMVKVGQFIFQSTAPAGPTEPDAAYVLELLKFASRGQGPEGQAARAEGDLAVLANDAPRIWSLLWQRTRWGIFGRGKKVGMKQSKRDDEVNAIVTNLLAYELYWRRTTATSFADNVHDRTANLLHRYQYIVSRIKAPKVRVKYAKRLRTKVFTNCDVQMWRGPSWGKFFTMGLPIKGFPGVVGALPAGMIIGGSITNSGQSSAKPNCDPDATILKLASQLAYAIGRNAILSINAKEYVGYGFGDLMSGITLVASAFSL